MWESNTYDQKAFLRAFIIFMSGHPISIFLTFMSVYRSVSFTLMPNKCVEVELEMYPYNVVIAACQKNGSEI